MCHTCSEIDPIDECQARLLFHKARQSRRKTTTFKLLKQQVEAFQSSRNYEKRNPYGNIRLEVVEPKISSKPRAKPRTIYPSQTPPKPSKRNLKPEPKPRNVFPSRVPPRPRERKHGSAIKIANGEDDAVPVIPSNLEPKDFSTIG